MRICNFGSLNIDYVYRVAHIVQPGETIGGQSFEVFAGGKGANQSVALARAGASVAHAGRVGEDGRWLVEKLADLGVETRHIHVGDGRTGHAIIQVDDNGQNAIVLYPGANHLIDRTRIDQTLEHFGAADVLLLQNEINDVPYLIEAGHRRGMTVCFNPAPFDETVREYPLDQVDLLIVNETEGRGLAGADLIIPTLAKQYPQTRIILTQGKAGATYHGPDGATSVPAVSVDVADTTAAGDTFIGYFLAARASGQAVKISLEQACRAAAICVAKPGAMDAIPSREEVQRSRT